MKDRPKVYVITGPTASGKSALAIELARHLKTEIISADSRQVYSGIPVSTAVPSIEERKGITHHLMEILDLTDYYSASLFEQQSLEIVNNLLREKGSAIICGGSMLYIDSFCNGIDDLPTIPAEIRESLMTEWHEKGDDWLRSLLHNLDPKYWEIVDLRNMKRVFHAVEICLTVNKPYSSLRTGRNVKRPFEIKKFCLDGPREQLFARINKRSLQMLESGLKEEAEKVYSLRHLNSLNTVGLKEMFAFFDGLLTLEEAISRIQKNTRVYAKKQLTWHKKDPSLTYLNFEDSPSKNIQLILQ